MLDQTGESRRALQQALGQHFVVGADLDGVHRIAAFERFVQCSAIVLARTGARLVPHQGLARCGVAQVVAVRADEVGRCRARGEKRQVELLARRLVQHHVDQRVEESGVGLGLDRHPLGRARAGDRQVRLDLHALHAAHARLGVAPDADDAARRFDVRAARDQVIAQRCVGADDEGAVPELAVQVFRVITLDALARAQAEVDRPPGGEERGKCSHVRLRRSAAAEARGDAWVA
ncbi:MAG: hypothetical protein ABL900_19650 [Burkholderiaceae bacterium]